MRSVTRNLGGGRWWHGAWAPRGTWSFEVVLLRVALAVGLAACSATDGALPPNVQDPETLRTPSGAMRLYRGVVDSFPLAVDRAAFQGGVLTDELAALPLAVGISGPYTTLDSRQLGMGDDGLYAALHRTRAQAREARGFLEAYTDGGSPALRGQLYTIEGYADILLADLFCSGIPLSTLDFNASYTLTPGFSTTDVYRHAVALFDSAWTLTGDSDSVQWQQLASVGRGRALLALGLYDSAAASASAVPDDFTYQVTAIPNPAFVDHNGAEFGAGQTPLQAALNAFLVPGEGGGRGAPSVGDREGVVGLDYLSSADPRTPLAEQVGITGSIFLPAQYPATGPVTFVLANAAEARLIEAEAALQASPDGGEWLTTLNRLRQTVGLPDTTDPLTEAGRVDLLFRERAFWLFMTGHRQGDLRRLIRQYHRAPSAVYPSGLYPGGPGQYGQEVVFPVPASEQELNPKYTGCFGRGA